jgi:hypothetical protein
MRKWIAGAALAASIVGIGGTAFAGEVNGNGKPTPIATYRAGSICSFSGLDDGSEGGPAGPGNVQSFGAIVSDAASNTPRGASSYTGLIRNEGPGVSCRGYASQGG